MSKIEEENQNLRVEIEKLKAAISIKDSVILETMKKKSVFTPSLVAIFVAIIGLLGTCIVSFIQTGANQKLERQKFESEIILKAASSDNIEQNKKNLQFLLMAGFISDNNGQISKLVGSQQFDFRISDEYIDFVKKSGKVIDEEGKGISNVQVISSDFHRPYLTDSEGYWQTITPRSKQKELKEITFMKDGYQPVTIDYYRNSYTTVILKRIQN